MNHVHVDIFVATLVVDDCASDKRRCREDVYADVVLIRVCEFVEQFGKCCDFFVQRSEFFVKELAVVCEFDAAPLIFKQGDSKFVFEPVDGLRERRLDQIVGL